MSNNTNGLRRGRRYTAERVDAVLEVIKGDLTKEQVGEKYGVRVDTLEGWYETAMRGMKAAFDGTLDVSVQSSQAPTPRPAPPPIPTPAASGREAAEIEVARLRAQIQKQLQAARAAADTFTQLAASFRQVCEEG